MKRPGLSLLELVIVLAVLVLLAALLVPMVGSTVQEAELDVTYATMTHIRDAIMGSPTNPAYFPDLKGLTIPGRDPDGVPRTLLDLFMAPVGAPLFDPQTRRGWRGPYISQTSANSTGVIEDAYQFRRPIILQWPDASSGIPASQWQQYVRLVSYGADGQPSPALATTWAPPVANPLVFGDDVVLYIRRDLPGMDWTNYWKLKDNQKAH